MDVKQICNECENTFQLDKLSLGASYYYASLPLCIIDAVFSIGVRYTSTKNTVFKYCQYYGLQEYDYKNRRENSRHTVSQFIENISSIGADKAAADVFQNKQRTSSKNGILKAEAVLRFAQVLHNHGIETFADIPEDGMPTIIETEIKKIPGQKSGLAYHYFCMLSGDDTQAKPDRHVMRFLKNATGKSYSVDAAQNILTKAAAQLKLKHPNISVRLLDYAIWDYMAHPKSKSKYYHKLVRDKIPKIIEQSGKTCVTEILSDEEYLKMVDAKLDEELAEYHEDQNIEELADLIEVIYATVTARGYTLEDLEKVRAEKAAKRGKFQNKILLKKVVEN